MMTARRLKFVGAAGFGLVALTGCSNDNHQNVFDDEGKYAHDIAHLNWIFVAAVTVGVLVGLATIVTLVKFRERPGASVPKQVHGHTALEIAWTIAPALILAVVAVPTIGTILKLNEKPKSCVHVNVVGQQWWWEFSYDNGAATANEMVIPAGEDVCLKISSRDVIHSFWVPRLNGKKDAVPGRVHDWYIQADKPGDYWGQCAEFCGLSHANMRIRVRALSRPDFDKWYANEAKPALQPATDAALRGASTFAQQCASCHVVRGALDSSGNPVDYSKPVPLKSGAAPNLTHFAARSQFAGATFPLYVDDPATKDVNEADPYSTPNPNLNRAQLEAWLRNPTSQVPMNPEQQRGMPNLHLSETQIDDLVAFLSGLK
ncbi:MAG: cytochrome c oxidase subunit [Acidimicrobiia bacterium]|nr:cytochrome c oxidase subunit [Acidimicrobiia bacterium]